MKQESFQKGFAWALLGVAVLTLFIDFHIAKFYKKSKEFFLYPFMFNH